MHARFRVRRDVEESEYLKEAVRQLRGLKKVADKALAQTEPADFFATLDEESNSIALIVKHLAGNMRSRWTDFLTSDGEKEDRHRDSEFVLEPGDTRESLEHRWHEGWSLLFSTVEPLAEEDLRRSVRIRGESLSVLRAINLQVGHYAYHIGQLVLLAKHFAGSRWESLSIPRGKSEEFNARRRERR
jgi:Protein of unknown function (DUF1572)